MSRLKSQSFFLIHLKNKAKNKTLCKRHFSKVKIKLLSLYFIDSIVALKCKILNYQFFQKDLTKSTDTLGLKIMDNSWFITFIVGCIVGYLIGKHN